MQFLIIGAAILDVLAQPVDSSKLNVPSYPAQQITMAIGGDAANEAIVLSRLGANVSFVGKIGSDFTGDTILQALTSNGVDCTYIKREPALHTGINVVLVDSHGERSFITNKNGSLRKLSPCDIPLSIFQEGQIVCFASMFVFPYFTPAAMAQLFSHIKKQGCLLCADMTRRKQEETMYDVKDALSCLDYVFPNYEEARLLTGKADPDEIADAFLACGTGCVVLKLGQEGCLIKTNTQRILVPAYPYANCLDTTGAGDTFAAAFLYALSQEFSLTDCGLLANAAGSLAVETVGATGAIHSLEQLLMRFEELKALSPI